MTVEKEDWEDLELGGEGYRERFIFSLRHKKVEELHLHHRWEMGKGQEKMRLDLYVKRRMKCSRTRAQKAIEMGAIRLNDRCAKPSSLVRPGDNVKLLLPYPLPPPIEAEKLPLKIVYEDDCLLLIDKAAGMVCHPTLGHRTGTMFQGLLFYFEGLQKKGLLSEEARPGLVHRIDADTTGLLVVAKSKEVLSFLSKQFQRHGVERFYQALVWGRLSSERGVIRYRIGPSLHDGTRWATFPEDSEWGRLAVTHYEVERHFGVATLIKCHLETGRTHQIRLHLAAIGHPLVGDQLYCKELPKVALLPEYAKKRSFLEGIQHHLLHARTLGFIHPCTGEKISFEVDLPEDFRRLLEVLES